MTLKLNKLLKKKVKDTAGKNWFDMPAPTITPELKNDLQLLKGKSRSLMSVFRPDASWHAIYSNSLLCQGIQDSMQGHGCLHSSGRRFERRLSMTGALEVGSRGADNYHTSSVLDSCNAQSLKELENQLDSLFHEVKALIRSGKESDATELLEANYESVKEQMGAGTKGIEEEAILDVIAMGYMALGDTRLIGPLLDMLSMVVNGLEDNEPLLGSILTHMGNMCEKLQKFETAVDMYNRAVGIIERSYGDSNVVLITPLLGRTKVLASIGKASKAVEGYHRVIKILEWSRGLINEELVLPLVLLGDLLLKEGKATEAEDVFNRTLSIYKKLYGEEDGRVGMDMCSLGHVRCTKGFVNEAIDL